MVAEVVQKDVPVYREWVASMDGIVNATILAQVEGYLIKQDYKEGDFVKKGDLLFEIDPRPFRATLDEARATPDKVLEGLKGFKGKVIQTSLTKDKEEELRAILEKA